MVCHKLMAHYVWNYKWLMMLKREKWEMTSVVVHDLAFIPLGRFNDGIYDNVLSHSNAYRGANQALDF